MALNERFYAEGSRFALKFSCEDCAHFDAESGRCAHGYPNAMHLRAAFEPESQKVAMFCKEFDFV